MKFSSGDSIVRYGGMEPLDWATIEGIVGEEGYILRRGGGRPEYSTQSIAYTDQYYELAPAQVDSPALQSTDEGFESPGGRQEPIWNERDAHNRELEARINAKRQIITLLKDEILELEARKVT